MQQWKIKLAEVFFKSALKNNNYKDMCFRLRFGSVNAINTFNLKCLIMEYTIPKFILVHQKSLHTNV